MRGLNNIPVSAFSKILHLTNIRDSADRNGGSAARAKTGNGDDGLLARNRATGSGFLDGDGGHFINGGELFAVGARPRVLRGQRRRLRAIGAVPNATGEHLFGLFVHAAAGAGAVFLNLAVAHADRPIF